MKTTVGQIIDKIDEMQLIVRELESGLRIGDCDADKVIEYLNEYINILECVKVDI